MPSQFVSIPAPSDAFFSKSTTPNNWSSRKHQPRNNSQCHFHKNDVPNKTPLQSSISNSPITSLKQESATIDSASSPNPTDILTENTTTTLTSSNFSQMSYQEQCNRLSDAICPICKKLVPEVAGKITGILINNLEPQHLRSLVITPTLLESKILESRKFVDFCKFTPIPTPAIIQQPTEIKPKSNSSTHNTNNSNQAPVTQETPSSIYPESTSQIPPPDTNSQTQKCTLYSDLSPIRSPSPSPSLATNNLIPTNNSSLNKSLEVYENILSTSTISKLKKLASTPTTTMIPHKKHHNMGLYSNHDTPLSYSWGSESITSDTWHPALDTTLQEIQNSILSTVPQTNVCLFNEFENGSHRTPAHFDINQDSQNLDVSIGTARPFIFTNKSTNEQVIITLKEGTILVLHPDCNKYWRHERPKCPTIKKAAYSFTFRHVHPQSSTQ